MKKKEVNIVENRTFFMIPDLIINDIKGIKNLKIEFFNNFNYFFETLIKKIDPFTIREHTNMPISTKNIVNLINNVCATDNDKTLCYQSFFYNTYKSVDINEYNYIYKNAKLNDKVNKDSDFYINTLIRYRKFNNNFISNFTLNENNVLNLNLSLSEIKKIIKDKSDFEILSFLAFKNSKYIPQELLTYNILHRVNNRLLTKIFSKYDINSEEIKIFLTNHKNGNKKLNSSILDILYEKIRNIENNQMFNGLVDKKILIKKDIDFYINEFKDYDNTNVSIKYKKYYKELLIENAFVDIDFIEKFKDIINFKDLSKNKYLTKEIIIKYFELFHLDTLLKYHKFDNDFLKNLIDKELISFSSQKIFLLNNYQNFNPDNISDKLQNNSNKQVLESFLKSQQLSEKDLTNIYLNNKKTLPLILKYQKNIKKFIDDNYHNFTKEDKQNIFNNIHYFISCKESEYKKHYNNLLESNSYINFSIIYDLSLIKLCRDFNIDYFTKNQIDEKGSEVKKTFFFNRDTNLIIDNNINSSKKQEFQQKKIQDFGISLM